MSIIDKLKLAEELTSAEMETVKYILDNQEEIINLNISDLAAAAFTSNATIIRICRKIGLSGYKEFKIKLVKELERKRKEKADVDINFPFREKESGEEIIKRIAELSKESIERCYESISSDDISKAAELILKAQSTYIYATGDSLISSIGFANRLTKLKVNTVIAGQYGETAANTYNVTEDDVALFVSYSGRSIIEDKYMKVLRGSGCKIIMITASNASEGFDIVIRFPDEESNEEKIATYYSQISINYILNCIYAVIFASDYSRNYNKKHRIEKHL